MTDRTDVPSAVYSIALQRAIEWHCRGLEVPPEIAAECPHHAAMLNKAAAVIEVALREKIAEWREQLKFFELGHEKIQARGWLDTLEQLLSQSAPASQAYTLERVLLDAWMRNCEVRIPPTGGTGGFDCFVVCKTTNQEYRGYSRQSLGDAIHDAVKGRAQWIANMTKIDDCKVYEPIYCAIEFKPAPVAAPASEPSEIKPTTFSAEDIASFGPDDGLNCDPAADQPAAEGGERIEADTDRPMTYQQLAAMYDELVNAPQIVSQLRSDLEQANTATDQMRRLWDEQRDKVTHLLLKCDGLQKRTEAAEAKLAKGEAANG